MRAWPTTIMGVRSVLKGPSPIFESMNANPELLKRITVDDRPCAPFGGREDVGEA
jgi:hypothetical protein